MLKVALCDPCHFQTASGNSVALAASRAIAIGTQFKDPLAKTSESWEGWVPSSVDPAGVWI